MLVKPRIRNYVDEEHNPAGGEVDGIGLHIVWQDGPLGRGENRLEHNGAFVESVIYAAKQRLEFYQNSKFKCKENEDAIMYLENALLVLNDRTARREAKGIEGTHMEDN